MSAGDNIIRVKTYFGSKAVWMNIITIASIMFPVVSRWTGGMDINGLAQAIADVVAAACAGASIVFRGKADGPLVLSSTVAAAANANIEAGFHPKAAVAMAKRAA